VHMRGVDSRCQWIARDGPLFDTEPTAVLTTLTAWHRIARFRIMEAAAAIQAGIREAIRGGAA